MSEIRDTFFANKAVAALWDVAVSMKRGNPLPLDASAVFESYAALEAYIADKESVAYPGQIIAVVNADSTGIYYLDQNLAINEVGKIPTADNKSIEIADGVITMHDYGTAYYKYVPEEKNEETGEVIKEAGYEKTAVVEGTTPWKAGLEPRVVSENGEFVIGWFEPNPTTVEGVKDQVTAVQGTVNDLNDIINEEGGLVDQVEELQEEIGHAATETDDAATGLYAELEKKANVEDVYTKDEVDEAHRLVNEAINAKADANNVYTKSEIYTQAETNTAIAAAVAGADHLKRKIVANKAAIQTYIDEHDDAEKYIFMVPTVYNYTSESNRYDEYIVLSSVEGEGDEAVTTYIIEPVGSWAVDLADYVSETELTAYLNDYYDKDDVADILTAYAKTSDLDGYYKIDEIDDLLENIYTKEDLAKLLKDYYSANEIDTKLANYDNKEAIAENYYNKEEINNKFADYYTSEVADEKFVAKEDGKSLVSNSEIEKLATVKANAEENFIKSTTERFTVVNGQLDLVPLGVNDIDGLTTALSGKVDTVFYPVPVVDENGDPVYEEDGETQKQEMVAGELLSPEDKAKLSALVIGDEGIQISGKVNADNVEGLSSWVIKNRNNIDGLYPVTDAQKLAAIEAGAEKNYVRAVSDELIVSTSGTLSINNVSAQKLTDLSSDFVYVENTGLALANDYVLTTIYKAEVGDLSKLIKATEGEGPTTLVDEVNYINERLAWRELTEAQA